MGRLYVCVTAFTEDGHKIKEEFANGLAINYAYDGNGNCTKEWDNAGGCTRYRYDENGNLAEKSILCDAKHAHYKTLRYGYRRNGSLQWEEDAEGNRTEYYFSTLEDPEDSQYSYDPAGNLTEENYLTMDGTSTKRLHYAYDVYNRNVSVTGDDFTQKNHYDVEDYRDSITEKDKVTNFVYQGGMLLHELDEEKIRQGIMYLAMMKI